MKLNAACMKRWMLEGAVPLSCISLFHTGSFMFLTILWILIGFMIPERQKPLYRRKVSFVCEASRACFCWMAGNSLHVFLTFTANNLGISSGQSWFLFELGTGILSFLFMIFWMKNQFSEKKALGWSMVLGCFMTVWA